MVIRKQNCVKPGRRKEQRSSNSTESKKMERNGINKSDGAKRR
jgi:hypothetical protein